MESDPVLTDDLFRLFNATLNPNAALSLKRILHTKLCCREDITDRNQIIKCFIKNHALFESYQYSGLYYREVFMNLEQNQFITILYYDSPLKIIDSRKKTAQQLKGKVIQLILFLRMYYKAYVENFEADTLPPVYKRTFEEFRNYFLSFRLDFHHGLIDRKKISSEDILNILKTVHKHYRINGSLSFIDAFSEFEAFISIAKKTVEHKLSFAEIDEHRNFSFTDLYHPQLSDPVKNSGVFSTGVTLLTGANMAGKSTFLKALGISVYLAHIGLPVPAEKFTTPYYDELYIFISNNDDLHSGYSYFMQEMLNLKKTVLSCISSNRCFVLFDELFRGTNSEDALEILSLTLEGLTRFSESFFMISTHIHELKNIKSVQHKVATYYIECLVNNGLPEFTFKLKPGFSDLKLGKILFEKIQLGELLTTEP